MASQRDLGRAYVSIVPDTKKFKSELQAELKKALAGTEQSVKVEADTSKLTEKVKKASKEVKTDLKDAAGDVKVGADTSDLTDKVKKASKEVKDDLREAAGNVKVGADTSELTDKVKTAAKEVNADLEKLKDEAKAILGDGIKFDIDANDSRAIAKLDTIKARLKEFSSQTAEGKTDVDVAKSQAKLSSIKADLDEFGKKHDTATAKINIDGEAKLAAADLELDAFGKKRVTAKANVDTSPAKRSLLGLFGGGGGGGIEGEVEKGASDAGRGAGDAFKGGFGTGLPPGVLGPLIVAAVGALPAAIGVVGAAAGVALGAGIIALAIKQVKTDGKQLTKALKQQATDQKALSAAEQSGNEAAIKSAQQKLKSDNETVKSLQAQLKELSKFQNVYNDLKDQWVGIQKTLFSSVADSGFLKDADDAVKRLGGEVSKLKGPLTKLFSASGSYIQPFVSMLLNLVHGVLPGLTSMLNTAKKPLSQFLEQLGKVTGNTLGQWFKDAAPYIKQSGNFVLGLVTALGKLGGAVITAGGMLSSVLGPALHTDDKYMKQLSDLMNPMVKGLEKVNGAANKASGSHKTLAQRIQQAAGSAANEWIPGLSSMGQMLGIVDGKTGKSKSVWADFNKHISSDWKGIKEAASAVTAWFTNSVPHAFSKAANATKGVWQPVTNFFRNSWNSVKSNTVSAWGSVKNTVASVGGWIANHIVGLWNTFKNVIGKGWGWVANNTVGVWNTVRGTISNVGGWIANHIVGLWNTFKNVIGKGWGWISNNTVGVWNTVRGTISNVGGWIANHIVGLWNTFRNVIGKGWGWIASNTVGVWNTIRNDIANVGGWLSNHFVGLWNTFRNVIGKGWGWIANNTVGVWNSIKNVIASVGGWLANHFVGLWNTFKNVIRLGWGIIVSVTKQDWDAIKNTVASIGGWIANHIVGLWNTFKNVISSGWNITVTATKVAWNVMKQSVATIGAWIANHVTGLWHSISNVTHSVWNGISGFFHGFWNDTRKGFSGLVSDIGKIWGGVSNAVKTPLHWMDTKIYEPFANIVNKGLGIFGVTAKLPKTLGLATGGMVNGDGSGIADQVPAMLSHGEYVMKAAAVRKIGKKNLDALNGYSGMAASGGTAGPNDTPGYANGGQVVNNAVKWKGHRYIWGGPANPNNGWDCSSFMSYTLGGQDGIKLPGGFKAPSNTHGPVAADFRTGSSIPFSKVAPGDIFVEKNGGHVGMSIANGQKGSKTVQGFAAIGKNYGTGPQVFDSGSFDAYHNPGINNKGLLGTAWDWLKGTVGSALTSAASAALSGVSGLMNKVVPGNKNTIPVQLAQGIPKALLSAAKNKINNNSNNWQGGAPGSAGEGDSGDGSAKQYSGLVKSTLKELGLPATLLNNWLTQIMTESSGNPNARQQVHDVNSGPNAAQGLLQVTPSTFAAFRSKSLPNNEFNPAANIYAAINYAKSRYGAGMGSTIGHGHGYFGGGIIHGPGVPKADSFNVPVSEGERVLTRSQSQNYAKDDPAPALLRTVIDRLDRHERLLADSANSNRTTAAATSGVGKGVRRAY